jgi:S-adenosylmethionine hydrolase
MAATGAPEPAITFLSDFGLDDGTVGAVHLVLARLAPRSAVIDLTHGIAAHDVAGGARALARAAPWLSPVALAIVDPGVGSSRQAVAVEAGDPPVVLVGPDNGLLLPTARALGGPRRVVALTDERWHTGPGGLRPGPDAGDVFAPVAAHVATGVDVGRLGPVLEPGSLVELDEPTASTDPEGVVHARIRWVDRFGNAQLDLDRLPEGPVSVRGAWGAVGAVPAASFSDIPEGALGLVVDAHGLVALACRTASAADRLGLRAGDHVRLAPPA